jgi:hypothetical protein
MPKTLLVASIAPVRLAYEKWVIRLVFLWRRKIAIPRHYEEGSHGLPEPKYINRHEFTAIYDCCAERTLRPGQGPCIAQQLAESGPFDTNKRHLPVGHLP